jgi:Neuraminidase (sialidase)
LLQRSFAFRGQPRSSRTTDGGRTWSRPISMTGNQNVYAQGNQIAVLPDGTLVNVFAILFKGSGIQPPQANQVFMAVTRSTDGGRSWHKIQKIAPIRTALLTDPDNLNPTSLKETVRADDYLYAVRANR